MRDIREMFLSKGVSLESKSFVGYVVRGDEAFVRNLLASMLFEDRLFFESISEEDAAFVREASRIIDEMASDLLVEFSEESVERLVCTAYASWKRVQIGKLIPGSSAHRTETKELAVAKRRSSELERLLCTKITSGELSYIADKLKEASVFRYDEVISENWIEMNLLVSRFIEEVSRSFPGAGFEQEDALYEGLLNHLRPAYWRAVNHVVRSSRRTRSRRRVHRRSRMMLLISLVTTLLLYTGSANTSLFCVCPLRGTVLPSLIFAESCFHDFFVTLFLRDQTTFIVPGDLIHSLLRLLNQLRLLLRNRHIGNGNRHSRSCGIFVTCRFNVIKNLRCRGRSMKSNAVFSYSCVSSRKRPETFLCLKWPSSSKGSFACAT